MDKGILAIDWEDQSVNQNNHIHYLAFLFLWVFASSWYNLRYWTSYIHTTLKFACNLDSNIQMPVFCQWLRDFLQTRLFLFFSNSPVHTDCHDADISTFSKLETNYTFHSNLVVQNTSKRAFWFSSWVDERVRLLAKRNQVILGHRTYRRSPPLR